MYKRILIGLIVLLVTMTAMGLGLVGCDGCGGNQTDTDSTTDTSGNTNTDNGQGSDTTDTDTDTGGGTDQGQVDQPPPVQNGTSGHATRYWDCCKPHCGWEANVEDAGVNAVGTCTEDNVPNGVSYTIKSSCDGYSQDILYDYEGKKINYGFTCWNMAPYAVNDNLSYGYAAVSAAGDICGKCYQLDFTGTSFNAGKDKGSEALKDKTMIVQATNIGYDVGTGQIDLLIPGGGVGAFDACTKQWGVADNETYKMGKRYGGLLAACKNDPNDLENPGLGPNASHDDYKTCVMESCEALFSKDGMKDLLDGCRWFVNWFEVADNPNLTFKEVECPDALNDVSGMLP